MKNLYGPANRSTNKRKQQIVTAGSDSSLRKKRRTLTAADDYQCTDDTTTSTRTPRLFQLPAEIRNTIYAYAVVQEEEIVLTAQSCSSPALLRTCRQIREEARSIFYNDNSFTISLRDFKLQPRPQHWFWTEDLESCSVNPFGKLNWHNIKEWARLSHKNKVCVMKHVSNPWSDADNSQRMVMNHMWNIVTVMRDAGADWDATVRVLEAFKEGINGKKGKWKFN